MNIAALGISHKTSTLEMREAVSFSSSQVKDALKRLKALYPAHEFVILSTCNRMEIYAGSMVEEIRFEDIVSFLSSYHKIETCDIAPCIYKYAGKEAVLHLFAVASGIDSLVVGETQIFGQLKNAYKLACESGATGKTLNIAFQRAFAAGKKARALTGIGDGDVSISSVSCQLADEILGGLFGKSVLLIGVGKVGTLTLKTLRSRGADMVVVSSRNYEKAKILAEEFGGRAVRFEEKEDYMIEADVVISSTSAPHHIIRADRFEKIAKKRRHKPVFLIDVAVPRDIDPRISRLAGVHLYNVDSLKRIADENVKVRKSKVFHCEKIIDRETAFFMNRRVRNAASTPEFGNDTLLKAFTPRDGKSFLPALF